MLSGFLRRNLRGCPTSSKRTAYLALVRPTLEYGAVVWDPHSKANIDRLERIQHRAARFITGDYRSRQPGCITKMLGNLQLPSLQVRRKQLRLTFMYKVVGGLIPGIPSQLYFTPKKPGRRIRPRTLFNSPPTTPIESSIANNSKCLKVPRCNTNQFKYSFVNRTIIDWNHLEENVVQAESVDSFKSLLSRSPLSSK